MRGMNRVFLIGNVGRDPEMRKSARGESWCSFSLATNRRVRAADGTWSEEADWHEIRTFGRVADVCARHVSRGRMIAVEGSLAYSKWKDDAGNQRVSARILADRVEFLDREARSSESRTSEELSAPAPASRKEADVPGPPPRREADIPF